MVLTQQIIAFLAPLQIYARNHLPRKHLFLYFLSIKAIQNLVIEKNVYCLCIAKSCFLIFALDKQVWEIYLTNNEVFVWKIYVYDILCH